MSFWMVAKRNGTCKECDSDILEGDRMVYDDKEYKAYCDACGKDLIGPDPFVSEKERKEALKHAQSRSKRGRPPKK